MSPGVPVAAADGMRIVPGSEAFFLFFVFFAQPIGGPRAHLDPCRVSKWIIEPQEKEKKGLTGRKISQTTLSVKHFTVSKRGC